jgi:uncharacterized protein YecT (DUF1311 family)
MKRYGYVVISFIVVILIGTAGAKAQAQPDLNKEACGKLQKADEELNRTYNKILRVYKDDTEFIEKLRAAQRAWIAFRDAHIASIFPKSRQGEYGSVKPMCTCEILATFTSERTKVLNQWLTGVEEGEVCSGSIKSKGELRNLMKDGSQ